MDLRKDYDEEAVVDGGNVYRKEAIIQVWWHHDVFGKEIQKHLQSETWTHPDVTVSMAKEEFKDMVDRWK